MNYKIKLSQGNKNNTELGYDTGLWVLTTDLYELC